MTTPEVPYLSDDRIEREAAHLLSAFGRDRRWVAEPPVPIDDLLELHLKIELQIRDLQAELGVPDVHGAIWVGERRIAVDRHLDPDLYPALRGRYHFTLAHEVGHWHLHRRFFAAGRSGGPDFVGRTPFRSRIEYQADRFAAFLLMPRRLVRRAWERVHGLEPIAFTDLGRQRESLLVAELRRRGGGRVGPRDEVSLVFEHLSRPLAGEFRVSPAAMRYRLETCGLLVRPAPALA